MNIGDVKTGEMVRVSNIDDTVLDSIPSEYRSICGPLVRNRKMGACGTVKEWNVEQPVPIFNNLLWVVCHRPSVDGNNVRAIYGPGELAPAQ